VLFAVYTISFCSKSWVYFPRSTPHIHTCIVVICRAESFHAHVCILCRQPADDSNMCEYCRQSRSTNHTNSASRDNDGCRPFTGNNRNVFLHRTRRFHQRLLRWSYFLYKMLYIVDELHGLKVIVMLCRTSHREICTERRSRNAPLCNWPERRRRSWISVQQRGRHPRATEQRHTKAHVRQVLRDHGRAVLPYHYRRSTSADDYTFSFVTGRPVRRSQHRHRRYSQRIYVVHWKF